MHKNYNQGKDKIFYNVYAKEEGNTIVLTPPAGVKPEAVRYCYKDFCVGTVYNLRGNPLSSFRTDNWDKQTNLIRITQKNNLKFCVSK